MTFHPHTARRDAIGVNRVVEITDFDKIDPNPDSLCRLKRVVDEFDVLEAANPTAWEAAVALVSARYRAMFFGCDLDRKRYRYKVYGYEKQVHDLVRASLEAALIASVAGASAFVRNSATSGDVTSWTELLTENHVVANAARAPTAQADCSLAFTAATPDVASWAIAGTNFSTDYLAIYFRVKPTAAVGLQTLYSLHIGTAGASARCLQIMMNGADLRIDVYAAVNHGRRHTFNSVFAAGVPRMIGFEFNKDGTDDGRVVATRDATVLVPDSIVDLSATPMTPALLVNVTGFGLFGNFNDSAVAFQPYGGQYGRWVMTRAGSVMAGVTTTGVLTQDARDALLAFEPLV